MWLQTFRLYEAQKYLWLIIILQTLRRDAAPNFFDSGLRICYFGFIKFRFSVVPLIFNL